MSNSLPVEMYWDPQSLVMRPANPFWARRASKTFTAGEVLYIVNEPRRSTASHNHYFASVEKAWASLPEMLAERFPTDDHLRKYALVKTGWYNSNSIPMVNHQAALRLASFIRPLDEFAVVEVKEAVVTVYTAKSQSFKDMGKEDFEASKNDVIEYLATVIGVTAKQLQNEGKR